MSTIITRIMRPKKLVIAVMTTSQENIQNPNETVMKHLQRLKEE